MKKIPNIEGEFYHVYNRGVDKREIFSDQEDVDRFLKSMIEFNVVEPIRSIYENSFLKEKKHQDKLVEFVCFSLVINHYHFILKQVSEKGIEKFMQRLSNGYTKYFNNKQKRSGTLFQGRYKSKHIDSDNYLFHLSAYVNLNQKVHPLGHSMSKLKLYSSWGEYKNEKNNNIKICEKDVILSRYKNREEYINFAESSLKDMIITKQKSKKDLGLYME